MRRATRIRQDWLLHPGRTPLEKLTIAAIEQTGGRISRRNLRHALPASNARVDEAVRSLEESGNIRVHRPTKRRPGSHRWTQANRYQTFDTTDKRGVWLPGRNTFDPGDTSARWIIYGIHLHEQKVAGAVQMPADAMAHLAGTGVTTNAVRQARADWTKRGGLETISTKPAVYAVPSDRYPPGLDRFEPNRTKKHRIAEGVRLYGTKKQADTIKKQLGQLRPEDAAAALQTIKTCLLASEVLDEGWMLLPLESKIVSQGTHLDPFFVSQGTRKSVNHTTNREASSLASLAAGGYAADGRGIDGSAGSPPDLLTDLDPLEPGGRLRDDDLIEGLDYVLSS